VVADDGVFLEEIVEDDAEFENFAGEDAWHRERMR